MSAARFTSRGGQGEDKKAGEKEGEARRGTVKLIAESGGSAYRS